MSVRLNEDEIWAFLHEAHTGILTTLKRDGWPISLPVWFAALDRKVYVAGPAQTKKFARVRHDDRVGFLAETGIYWKDLKAVHLQGRARIVADDALIARVQQRLDEKYEAFRTKRSSMPAATQQHYERKGPTVIEIQPLPRVLSWHNAKLSLKS
jgi:nitroimidazol reductase NimA-like FMN-containing flavoprotein (pyridoxamine 5'-phosphate oxidase superfamily)